VGPRAGLDIEARGKILCPCRGSNPDLPVVQPVVRHYVLFEIRTEILNIISTIIGFKELIERLSTASMFYMK
jgi:hypothetical protein